MRARLLFLFICVVAWSLPQNSTAQVQRSDQAFYLKARVGASAYGGERDMNSSNNLGDILSNTGFPGIGFEVGYSTLNLEPLSASVGIAYHGGSYENITTNLTPFPPLDGGSSEWRHTVGLIGTLGFLPTKRINPYILGGVGLSIASIDFANGDSETNTAFSPTVGLGADININDRWSFFLEASGAITSDEEMDAADGPDADILGFLGGGLRFNFIAIPAEPVQITAVDGPTRLEVGQEGTFTATTNPDAETPVEYNWDFGDGAMGTGTNATHAFDEDGTYTVTFTASNEVNTATETLEVTVEAPVPAEVVTMNANPNPGTEGEPISFSSNVRGDTPVDYNWDFGDGSTGSGASPSHTYDEPGTYTVTLTVSNEAGEDTRTMTVTADPALAAICTEVTEMNAAFFSRNASTLTDEGRSALQENLDILSQCPNLSVRVEGYASPFERNEDALSEDRARAVGQFYQDNGIAASRITVRGMGAVEGVTSKKGGTEQFRRADSIPVRSGDGMDN